MEKQTANPLAKSSIMMLRSCVPSFPAGDTITVNCKPSRSNWYIQVSTFSSGIRSGAASRRKLSGLTVTSEKIEGTLNGATTSDSASIEITHLPASSSSSMALASRSQAAAGSGST
ncbi:hypothetical protein D3C72_1721350 [compost metagenome]